jgi:hypothetical protein
MTVLSEKKSEVATFWRQMAHVAGANTRVKITQRTDLISEAMAIYNDTAHHQRNTRSRAHRNITFLSFLFPTAALTENSHKQYKIYCVRDKGGSFPCV